MRACLFALMLLVSSAMADRDVAASFSSATMSTITGTADGKVSFDFGTLNGPPKIIVTADATTTITVTALASSDLSGTFPSDGIGGINLLVSGKIGFRIQSSNSAASLTLQLVTPDISGLLTAGTQVGGIFYYTGSAYVAVPSTYTSGVLTCNLPGVGDYVVASINTQVSAYFNQPKAIVGGVNRTYQWANNFAITIWTQTSNSITVKSSSNTTLGTQAQRDAIGLDLGIYYDIELQDTTQSHVSTIMYTYTNAELQAKSLATSAAAKLRWAFYDTVATAWTLAAASDCHVDLSAMVVSQTTTHFSSWGVYYSAAPSLVSPSALLLAAIVACLSLIA